MGSGGPLLALVVVAALLHGASADPGRRRAKLTKQFRHEFRTNGTEGGGGGGDGATEAGQKGRTGKLFPIFQIVTFPNDACSGGTKNGTCYTSAECSSRAGVNSGTCASGYGVCCVFNINCGMTSSENCTYFESNAVMSGACTATICPCSSNICQLRLDFNNFVISGPVTTSASTNKATAGAVFPAGAVSVSQTSRCLTDTFAVTGSGGSTNSDVLCGTNTGEHRKESTLA